MHEEFKKIRAVLVNLEKELGKIQKIQQLSEGVYYISLQQPAKPICSEYYVVLADSPVC